MAGIRVEQVSKEYSLGRGEGRLALAGVDLEVAEGEFVCVVGPSGCGKTTLLNILGGLDRAYSGTLTYISPAGTELPPTTPPHSAYVFQESRLLPWLNVRENVAFVLDGPRRDRAARADAWLEKVGLAGFERYYPGQLSAGMRQRVAVARAFVVEPEILLMDEPFSALDELTGLRLRNELLRLWEERGCTVVFVTHNPIEAVYLADRVVVMSGGPGRVVAELPVSRRLGRPRRIEDEALWRLSREAVRMIMEGSA